MSKLQKLIRLLLGLLGVLILVPSLIMAIIFFQSKPYRAEEIDALPDMRVAIVFGALVYRSGELSPVLKDRVLAGVTLYHAGKVKKLLMSGDNRFVDYNEVQAMRNYAIEQGVPEADIVMDHAGRSTYDTCYRAVNIFQVEEAILVTQNYHSPRAVYTCRSLGLDAFGYGIEDFTKYPELQRPYLVREAGAQLKAWWEVNITKPTAEIMGNLEPPI